MLLYFYKLLRRIKERAQESGENKKSKREKKSEKEYKKATKPHHPSKAKKLFVWKRNNEGGIKVMYRKKTPFWRKGVERVYLTKVNRKWEK